MSYLGNPVIIEIEQQLSTEDGIKPLVKSYSSPLPTKTTHLSIDHNYILSAHTFNQYQSSHSCVIENITSGDESNEQQRFTQGRNLHRIRPHD